MQSNDDVKSDNSLSVFFVGRSAFEYTSILSRMTRGLSITNLVKVARSAGIPITRTSKGVMISTLAKFCVVAQPAVVVQFFTLLCSAQVATASSFSAEELDYLNETFFSIKNGYLVETYLVPFITYMLALSVWCAEAFLDLIIRIFCPLYYTNPKLLLMSSFVFIMLLPWFLWISNWWTLRKNSQRILNEKVITDTRMSFLQCKIKRIEIENDQYSYVVDSANGNITLTFPSIKGSLLEPLSAVSDQTEERVNSKAIFVNEAMRIGSEILPLDKKGDWPVGLIEMRIQVDDNKWMHQGWCVRVDNLLVCTEHQVIHGVKTALCTPKVAFEYEIASQKPVVRFNDVVVFELNQNIWGQLGVKSAPVQTIKSKDSIFAKNLIVQLYGYSGSDATKLHYSLGKAKIDGFNLEHEASTLEGWSGTPIYVNGKVVGIHTKGSKTSKNGGVVLLPLVVAATYKKGEIKESEYNWRTSTKKRASMKFYQNQSSGDFVVCLDDDIFIVEQEEWDAFLEKADDQDWLDQEQRSDLIHYAEPDDIYGATKQHMGRRAARKAAEVEQYRAQQFLTRQDETEEVIPESKKKQQRMRQPEKEVKTGKQEVSEPEAKFVPVAVATAAQQFEYQFAQYNKRLEELAKAMAEIGKKTHSQSVSQPEAAKTKAQLRKEKRKQKALDRKNKSIQEAVIVNGEIVDDAPEKETQPKNASAGVRRAPQPNSSVTASSTTSKDHSNSLAKSVELTEEQLNILSTTESLLKHPQISAILKQTPKPRSTPSSTTTSGSMEGRSS